MRASVHRKYGSPDELFIEEVDKPTPEQNEVLIKNHATSLNAWDWHMLRGKPSFMRLTGPGFLKPKNPILGADISGVVEAVGIGVTRFKIGDAVYGDVASKFGGGTAEYVCAHDNKIALKPENLTHEEAAAVPMAALTALQGLRDVGQITAGQKVLINGSSGGVGTFAVQIAKSFDTEVTAVCSTKNVEMAASLGADHVIDYTHENFTENGQQYDLILAANGYHPLTHYKRALSPNGIYSCTGGTMKQMFGTMLLAPMITIGSGKKMSMSSTDATHDDLVNLTALIEAGKVMSVIDRRYPLEETANAVRYLEEGHARGKIIITLLPNE